MRYSGALLLPLLLASCGSGPEEAEWLAAVGGDTVSVEDAAATWAGMPEAARQAYLQMDDTAEEYVRSLTVRSMIASEIDRLGLDTLPRVVAAGNALCWRRSLTLYRELLAERQADSVNDSLGGAWLEVTGGGEAAPDSAALERLVGHYSEDAPLRAADTLVHLPPLLLTSGDMAGAVYRERSVALTAPESRAWMEAFCRAVLGRMLAAEMLAREAPELLEEACEGADSVRTSAAVDLLYERYVRDSVTVTEGDLVALYMEIGTDLTMPERRSAYAARFETEEEASAFKEALGSGAPPPSDLLRGFPELAADSAAGLLTVPLLPEEVPGGLGEAVFGLGEADTTEWLGPVPHEPGLCWAAVRLAEVHPEHVPGLEEAMPLLEDLLTQELESQRYGQWMTELERRYSPELNVRLIRTLPADPSAWPPPASPPGSPPGSGQDS